MKLKLEPVYEETKNKTIEKIKGIEDILKRNIQIMYDNHNYTKNFEVRIYADLRDLIIPCGTVCDWYEKYNCHDDHVIALVKSVFRNEFPDVYNLIKELSNKG